MVSATHRDGLAPRPVAVGRSDSMITRQGRSARTVSSVLPNSACRVRGGSGSTIARARISLRLVDDDAARACPARTFSSGR